MDKNELINNGYFNLAAAILEKGIEDYKTLLTGNKIPHDYDEFDVEKKPEQLEEFFLSPFGQTLSLGNGEEIIRRVRNEYNTGTLCKQNIYFNWRHGKKREAKKVVCLETGEVYNSALEAAKALNCYAARASTIRRVCNHEGTSAMGCHWLWEEEYNKMTEEEINEVANKKIGLERKVICVETGEVFPSIANAAKSTGCAISTLSNTLLGRNETCRGYHWEYFDE